MRKLLILLAFGISFCTAQTLTKDEIIVLKNLVKSQMTVVDSVALQIQATTDSLVKVWRAEIDDYKAKNKTTVLSREFQELTMAKYKPKFDSLKTAKKKQRLVIQ